MFNKKHSVVFAGLLIFSWFFVVGILPQRLPLTRVEQGQMLNSYFLYESFSGIPQTGYENYRFILGKMLGIGLGVDWYDLCLRNDTNPQTIIGKLVFPIGRNITLTEIDKWKNSSILTQGPLGQSPNLVVSHKLIASPDSTPSCIRISPDDIGFLYSGLFYYDEDKPVSLNAPQELVTISTINGKSFDLGGSVFELRINRDALLIKRFILFIALSALYLLILQIWHLIYKSKKREST